MMNGIQRLFEKLRRKDRRRTDRTESPKLAAYLWTNAAPQKHEIRDVSSTGFYLVTKERWYPGTQVMMTLQSEDGPGDKEKQSVAVQSLAVRSGEDGVGLMFMTPDKNSPAGDDTPTILKVDKKTLHAFLEQFLTGKR